MDPTTADFNAWLAEEGAKIGATVPPQPSNLLAMYGTGYVPADTAYEPTTADILARAEARNAGFPGFLRRVADTIPESGRHLEPRGQDEGLLSYWKRAADAMSVHDMAKGSLGTVANWLQGTPEIGPDTLAPLGLAPMGMALTPKNAIGSAGGKLASSLPMDEASSLGPLRGYHGSNQAFDTAEIGANRQGASGSREGPLGFWGTDNPATASHFADWAARGQDGANVMPLDFDFKNPLRVDDYAKVKDLVDAHTEFKRPGYEVGGRQIRMTDDKVNYEAARQALLDQGYDGITISKVLTDSPDGVTPIDQYVAIKPGTVRSATTGKTILSDQSRASVPGTLINAMDLERAKPASSDAAKPTYRDHALAEGKEDLWAKSQISGMSEFADRMITNPDDWRRRMDAGFDFLADKSPSKYLNARNDTGSVPGTVVNAQEDEDKKKRKK